jgi:hypothetical protein
MTDEVPQPPTKPTKPKKQSKKTFSVEQARAQIVAKLEKAGAKGALSPVTAKTAPQKLAALERALAELEAAHEIFVDRRKPKERYYFWAVRPPIPTRESVAAALEAFAEREFPRLLSPADLKDALGKDKEAQSFIFRAFELLAAERRLIVLRYQPSKKKTVELYAHLESLRKALDPVASTSLKEITAPSTDATLTAPPPLSPEFIHVAYQTIAEQTGFPAVPISSLQQGCAVPLDALKSWLVEEYKNGRAVLSSGDWSLADETKRAAAVEINGERYLLVRLMS